MPGEWYISGIEAKAHPIEFMKTKAGGQMAMRAIPLDELSPLERVDEEEIINQFKEESLASLQPICENTRLFEV